MSRIQKWISVGILVLVLVGLGWQYAGWQKQVERHQNALNFWQVQVPKVQEQYPEFNPQDIEQQVSHENQQFEEQKRAVYANSGVILFLGLLSFGAVVFIRKKVEK